MKVREAVKAKAMAMAKKAGKAEAIKQVAKHASKL